MTPSPSPTRPRPDLHGGAWLASAFFTAVAVAMTWPLAAVIDERIAADMGDPLFNSWVMLWTGGQILRFLGGDFTALHDYWHGNIFHPETLTIAYSEHLLPQTLQALPVLALTDNVVLAYNLLFLSTFVLSALGMYLFVRDLTGSRLAGLIAGLAYAWAPYRFAHLGHLQVLSSQWMPFALWGFQRYFATGRTTALAWASAALLAQNLSCGYYLLFFSPLVAAYCLYEMTRRRRLGDLRVWRSLVLAAVVVAGASWPFVSPYLEVRRSGDVGVRSIEESRLFSADVYAFATAPELSRLWGNRLSAHRRGEGEAFPGFTILALAGLAVLIGARRDRLYSDERVPAVDFFGGTAIVAALLALGPTIHLGSVPVGAGPYALLHDWVPGFDGLRVPARFAMIVTLALAVLAGAGVAGLRRTRPAAALLVALAASAGILAEVWIGPMPSNRRLSSATHEATPDSLPTGDAISPLYQRVRDEPGEVVLLELPFGEPPWEIRATFFAGYHRRPLVNGYSGFFPEAYQRRVNFLDRIAVDPEAAERALRGSGATHVLVHEGAISNNLGPAITEWVRAMGAAEIGSDGRDVLFRLPAAGDRRPPRP